MATSDQIVGCIVGGAIGDCLGGPYEGMPGPLEVLAEAVWILSDDTQLTLATCEAIIKEGKPTPDQIALKMAEWHRQGRIRGIGASTYQALEALTAGAHWALAGARGEKAAGNGAAMRVAPLAFFFDPKDEQARHVIRDICRITHDSDEAYVGALAIVTAIREMIGRSNETKLDVERIALQLPDTAVRDRLLEFAAVDSNTHPIEVARRYGCSGYVVESVPFAIWCAHRADMTDLGGFLKSVVECGGDTDTVASMAGQIVGARIGFNAIPSRLMDALPDRDFVIGTAAAFAKRVSAKRK